MASKASMLKQGARKTGTGLFQGMKPLSAASETEDKKAPEKAKEEAKEESKETKEKAPTKKAEAPKPEVKETVKKEAEKPVAAQETVESENNKISSVTPSSTELVNEKQVAEPVVPQPKEPVFVEEPQPSQYVQQPNTQDMLQKVTEQAPAYMNQPMNQPVTAPVNQPVSQPVPTYVQPQEQTIAYTQQLQYSQPVPQQVPQYMNQPVVQPQYNQYAAYQQSVQTPAQPARRGRAAANSGEKSSRYEKDKFLLLDIRGYRDYVEHMAKAANMSATKYIRSLIEQDMLKNMDIYQAHKELEERLRGRQ